MKNIILFLLLLFFENACLSQESYLRHYAVNQGLPSNETYSAFQDSKGYIWIASDMGVSKFDGYNFKVYTSHDGLTDNTVFRFYEDSKARIWFYTFSGRMCYYFNDSIYTAGPGLNEKLRAFIGSGYITGISAGENDTMIITTSNGMLNLLPEFKGNKVQWNNFEITTTKETFKINGGYVTAEPVDGAKTLLTEHLTGKSEIKHLLPFRFDDFKSVTKLANGVLIVSGESFSAQITGNETLSRIRETRMVCWYESTDSTIWLGSLKQGIGLFNESNLLSPNKKFLLDYSVTSVLKDRENGYWFTTLEDGIFYLPSIQFNYFSLPNETLQYPKNSIHKASSGKIWWFGSKKLFEMDPDQIREVPLLWSQKNWDSLGTTLWNSYIDTSGEIWLGTSLGIGVFNNDLSRLKKNITIHGLDSRLIICDSKRNIWSLCHRCISEIDNGSKHVLRSVPLPSRAETACEDFNGNVLIGTLNGIYTLTPDTLIWAGAKSEIFKTRFVDIKRFNALMIGATRGGGLVIWNKDTLIQITTADGLLSNLCRSIFVENDGTIWVAGNKGLNAIRFEKKSNKMVINSFTVDDGLLSNDNFQVLKNDSLLWLLSNKGVSVFDPDKVLQNDSPPPVYIANITTDKKAIALKDRATLDYSTNFIQIGFTGLTYKNAGKQRYEYRLNGYDTATYCTQNTYVQFTKLPPGNYSFVVTCINNSGVKSDHPAIFSFTISRPFYQKTWFICLLFLLAICCLLVLTLFNIKRIRRRENRKTQLNRKIAGLEMESLRAQMNPHFIFNCLNAIQDFILSNDATSAKHYLSSFSKLIRKTLNNSRRSAINLQEEIDFLTLYLSLERMRFSE
ncbi:MAG: ypdA 5, partial [Bacteroidota bacterium]|nr:ypdA 5 [Bacteroidota bacterium]